MSEPNANSIDYSDAAAASDLGLHFTNVIFIGR